MNWEQLKGNWTETKGKLRQRYGELTDDEIEEAKGEREQLIGLITSKYGKAKLEVEKELDALFSRD